MRKRKGSMGAGVLEFESHILAENLDESFLRLRKVWRESLTMSLSNGEQEDLGEHQASSRRVGNGLNFAPIVHGLELLRRRLRPVTLTKQMMDLVRIREQMVLLET